ALGMLLSDMPIDTSACLLAEADVIIGGPMMGKSTPSLSAPIEKGTSGVTVVAPLPFNPEPCIRCGECVQACPMGLQPYLISTLSRLGKTTEAVAEGARDCIECGSCNYSCPSGRPIVDYIRLAKKSEKR
ncbi:MAG: 4Fe-4S dicluster domain-containing protein, partial [Muribaculaceae bacterium]|nr:4Fe-4S dicluster domain-containing protein [Muribaculaceae bacterium]